MACDRTPILTSSFRAFKISDSGKEASANTRSQFRAATSAKKQNERCGDECHVDRVPVSAGKASGGFGCDDVNATTSASPNDTGATRTDAPTAPGIDVTYETPVSDTVAGTTSTTGTMSIDTSMRGFINGNGDLDWYRVTLVAGQRSVRPRRTAGTGALEDSYPRLLNASGTEIAANDDAGPLHGARLTFTATTSGTYYISAGAYSGGGPVYPAMNAARRRSSRPCRGRCRRVPVEHLLGGRTAGPPATGRRRRLPSTSLVPEPDAPRSRAPRSSSGPMSRT